MNSTDHDRFGELLRAHPFPRVTARHTGVNLVGGSSQWNVQAYANVVLSPQGNGVFNSYLQTIALGNEGAVIINATDYTSSSSLVCTYALLVLLLLF